MADIPDKNYPTNLWSRQGLIRGDFQIYSMIWFNSFRITSHDKINFKDFYRYPTFLHVQETGWLHAIPFFAGRTYTHKKR